MRPKKEDLILSLLYSFSLKGRDEVSIAEIMYAVQKIQEKYPLGYTFWEGLPISLGLLNDLSELEFKGKVHRITYTHDAFLPKTFYKLSILGKGRGESCMRKLDEKMKTILENATREAIQEYRRLWRLWRRSPVYKEF